LEKETFVYISYNKTKIYTFDVNYCNTVTKSLKVKEKIVFGFALLYFSVITFITTGFK